MLKRAFFIFIVFNYLIISGCMNVPKNQGDACSIIKQKKSWRSALKKTERKWGVSPGMQLAFIKTESNFRPTARTQRKYIFSGSFPQVGFHQPTDILKHLMERGKNIKKAQDTNTIEDLISHTQQTLSDGI